MRQKWGVSALHADDRDPIELARANWERAGWGGVADGMVAVTSVMRAHQILLARVEALARRQRPGDVETTYRVGDLELDRLIRDKFEG